MSAARSYDAWLVDLDGTLYWQRPVRWLMAAELLLFAPHRIRAVQCFRREQERIRRHPPTGESPCCPYQSQLSQAATVLGCPPGQLTEIVRYWMEERPGKWLRLFRRRGLVSEIEAFRAAGGKTAVVSDYPASCKLASMRVESLFDAVVACGEPGGPRALKPDPAGYLQAAALVEVPASRCLVIGDRDVADGEAARRAGMDFRLIG
jgi:phosphoglycolate phosphatase/putative hydrolase of the HAD superfamily